MGLCRRVAAASSLRVLSSIGNTQAWRYLEIGNHFSRALVCARKPSSMQCVFSPPEASTGLAWLPKECSCPVHASVQGTLQRVAACQILVSRSLRHTPRECLSFAKSSCLGSGTYSMSASHRMKRRLLVVWSPRRVSSGTPLSKKSCKTLPVNPALCIGVATEAEIHKTQLSSRIRLSNPKPGKPRGHSCSSDRSEVACFFYQCVWPEKFERR